MASRLTATRMLLVCLLSRAVDSSALARARNAADHKPWQVETTQQVGLYGKRRPLQYVTSLREANQNKQLVQSESGPKSQLNLGQVPSPAHIQSQFSPRMPLLNPSWRQSEIATSRAQEISTTKPENHPLFTPRGFLLNLKIPIDSLISKADPSKSKGSDVSRVSGQYVDPTQDRLSSVEIHSGLGLPPISTNGAKEQNTNGNPKQNFHLKLIVPIQPPAERQTTSSIAAKYGVGQKQEHSGFIQSSHLNLERSTSAGAQIGTPSFPGAAQKHSDRILQGISTLFGARRPAVISAGGRLQPTKPVDVPLQSGSTLFEPPKPLQGSAAAKHQHPNKPLGVRPTFGANGPSWGSAGGGHGETYRPVDPKVALSPPHVGAQEPYGHFSGASSQSVYGQVDGTQPSLSMGAVKPHWGAASGAVGTGLHSKLLFGAGRPSLSSAGGVQEHTQIYDPKSQSISTIGVADRRLVGSAGGRRQYSYTPVETKPQSVSAGLGSQNPAWGSAGAAQQPSYQPAETNLQSRPQWPSWSSVSGTRREQSYVPVFMKPQLGSRQSGSGQPSLGDSRNAQQNTETYKPIQIELQAGSTGIRNPSMTFTNTAQPPETKPHVGSTLFGFNQPSFNSVPHWQKPAHNPPDSKLQTGSTLKKAENPSGASAGVRPQIYQPTEGQFTPSGGFSVQQSVPVDQYKLQTGLSRFPHTVASNVHSGHMTPQKPNSLTPTSFGSTNLPRPWLSTVSEGPQRGFYSIQEKPVGRNSAGQPTGLGASRDYTPHSYNPSVQTGPWSPAVPRPSAPSRIRRPPFVLNRDSTTSSNYDSEKMVEVVQKVFPSQQSSLREHAAPFNQPSSGFPPSIIWRPSTRPDFQLGQLRQGSNTVRVDGGNGYSQHFTGVADAADGLNIHLGSADDGVYSTGTNAVRRLMRPDPPALPPANSQRMVPPPVRHPPGVTPHFQPSEQAKENIPGRLQPATIRKLNLLIV